MACSYFRVIFLVCDGKWLGDSIGNLLHKNMHAQTQNMTILNVVVSLITMWRPPDKTSFFSCTIRLPLEFIHEDLLLEWEGTLIWLLYF